MLVVLGLSKGMIAAGIGVAAVVLTLVLWHLTRPPVLSSAELPPVVRRAMGWWIGMSLVLAAIGGGWVVLRGPLGLPRQGAYRYVPLVAGLAPLVVVNPWYAWRTAWLRRALKASKGRLCTHCGYDVSALGVSGTCPECGGSYDIAADAALWAGLARGRGAATASDDAEELPHR